MFDATFYKNIKQQRLVLQPSNARKTEFRNF